MTSLAESGRGCGFGSELSSRERVTQLEQYFGSDFQEVVRKNFVRVFGLSEKDVVVKPQPIHDGSQATYFAEFDHEDDKYYASAMGPNEKTSDAHFHEWPAGRIPPRVISAIDNKLKVNVAEEYHLLKGEAVLELETDGRRYEVVLNENHPSEVVHSGTLHRLRTEGSPALLLLKTRYGALLNPGELHKRPGNAILPLDEAR